MTLRVIIWIIFIWCHIGETKSSDSQFTLNRREIRALVDESFEHATNTVIADHIQNEKLLKSGIDSKDESLSQVELDMFTAEDKMAMLKGKTGMLILESLKYLQDKGIQQASLRRKFIRPWYRKARQYDPDDTKGQLSCDPDALYRTADGTCNNLDHPERGKSHSIQRRFLAAEYDDNIDKPRETSVTGEKLPSARQVSNTMMKCETEIHSDKNTVMVMAFGQFLDHDIVATPTFKGENGSSIKCCGIGIKRLECYPIKIPTDDPFFKHSDCMNFVRSTAVIDLENKRKFPPMRDHINQVTSYIDASAVYGSTEEQMNALRTFQNGKLKTNDYKIFPASSPHDCRLTHDGDFCMKAGDGRVNVVPNLSTLHVIFLRAHNKITVELQKINQHWNDEKLFQEARKIVAALIQQITYGEYLKTVLSRRTLWKYGLTLGKQSSYKKRINPSISNAFAAAAFRFGHSQITSHQSYFKNDSTMVDFKIEKTYHNPHVFQADKGSHISELGRWLSYIASDKTDRCFVSGVRDKLFFDKLNKSFDLPALNIQRGRDHGLPAYVKWRKWCRLSEPWSFCGLIDHDEKTALLLKEVYKDVKDIDLFTGGMTEQHEYGSDVGPTFSCILARQFRNLKKGDRFWYENKGVRTGFTEEQLEEIRKLKLSKIMCESLDMDSIQKDVFRMPSRSNKVEACSISDDINFNHWKDSSN